MTELDPALREQLCAWMDGELSADEARFLERRLQHDPQLQALLERWQLAAACARGQRVLAMPATLAPAIAAAIAGVDARRRRNPWPWLATAAALALVAVLMPAPVRDSSGSLATGPTPRLPRAVAADPAHGIQSPAAPAISELPLAESVQLQPWPRSPVLPGVDAGDPFVVRQQQLLAPAPVAAPLPPPPPPPEPPSRDEDER